MPLVERPEVEEEEVPPLGLALRDRPKLLQLALVLGRIELGRVRMPGEVQLGERGVLKRARGNGQFDDGRVRPAEPEIDRTVLDRVLCAHPGEAAVEVRDYQREEVTLREEPGWVLVRDLDERGAKLLQVVGRALP